MSHVPALRPIISMQSGDKIIGSFETLFAGSTYAVNLNHLLCRDVRLQFFRSSEMLCKFKG